MAEIKITKDNFNEEVIGAKKPVLLDFWATWCGPCKMIAPVLAELARKHSQKLTVGKVNIDEEMELAVQYKIVSIPTLLVFENGEMVAKTLGYHALADLENWLAEEGVL